MIRRWLHPSAIFHISMTRRATAVTVWKREVEAVGGCSPLTACAAAIAIDQVQQSYLGGPLALVFSQSKLNLLKGWSSCGAATRTAQSIHIMSVEWAERVSLAS